MATTPSIDPQVLTIQGRLSYPTFKYKDAVVRNAKSKFVKDPADVFPEFNILLTRGQLDAVKAHITDVFIPWCISQGKNKDKSGLSDAEAKRILDLLASEDWDNQPPYIPIKSVPEKTQPLAPEAVAMFKINGQKGTDVDLKAVVKNADELAVPDPTRVKYPVILPLDETVHAMQSGFVVATTLNLYAYLSGKVPGITAQAKACVFKEKAAQFGGGVELDDDAIFA